eukprot:TRINITY_DN6383_c0_g3_i8.p3 TRINITY_DN6383_c0_g3~~TRINITY_DN6383_c0_g3_i8.p3  ORF type:complete len:165 (+),score=19.77 TRINITY_DN6383_c0_g3_i8:559-1053(+)
MQKLWVGDQQGTSMILHNWIRNFVGRGGYHFLELQMFQLKTSHENSEAALTNLKKKLLNKNERSKSSSNLKLSERETGLKTDIQNLIHTLEKGAANKGRTEETLSHSATMRQRPEVKTFLATSAKESGVHALYRQNFPLKFPRDMLNLSLKHLIGTGSDMKGRC